MEASISWASLVVSLIAVTVSVVSLYFAAKSRKSDSFAKLYDELNTTSFGVAMERIAEWISDRAASREIDRRELAEADIRRDYRYHLQETDNAAATQDELEAARRTVKAWFIKCLLFFEAKDLTREQLGHLVTNDRAQLMWETFFMTREKMDVWSRQPFNPASRFSSDEPYFARFAELGFLRPHAAHARQ